MMKAIVYTRFGAPDVLRQVEHPEPPAAPGRARVRIHAAALNPKDALIRKGKLRWIARAPFPRVPGFDLAGVLLDDADGLAAGRPVFGMIQAHAGGAHAEVAALPFDELAAAPPSLSMAEAASLPLAGMTALQALRDMLSLQAGQRILINGASGGVGTLAVQIARALGAAEVVGVCSARNADFVGGLGAHRVIDYQTADPAAERGFDAIFDCYGTLPWAKAKACLTPGGRFCTAIPRPAAVAREAARRIGAHRAGLVIVRSRRADLDQLATWVERGQLRPVVQTVLPLAESAEAHRLIETRRTRGKIVLSVIG